MSRQSLAVNSSGALIGHRCRCAYWSPSTVMRDVERPARVGLRRRWSRSSIVDRPGGQLGCSERILVRMRMKQVVLVAEVAVVDVAGEAAAGAAEGVEDPAGVLGDVGVDGDEVGAVAEGGGAELGHADDVAGEVPLAVGGRDAHLGVEDQDPQRRRRRGRRCCVAASMAKVSFIWASFSGMLGGEVVGLGPVLVEVVELPGVLVGGPVLDARRRAGHPRGARPERGGHPAVVVDRRGCP